MTRQRGSLIIGFTLIFITLIGTMALAASTKNEVDDLNVDVVFKPETLQPISTDHLKYVDHENLIIYRGDLYFSALDDGNRWELWRTDGSPAGTSRITKLNPSGMAKPQNMTVFRNALYFTAKEGNRDPAFYRYNGEKTETVYDSNVMKGITILESVEFQGRLYFSVMRGDRHIILESDGDPKGYFREINKDISGEDFDLHEDSRMMVALDKIFFSALNKDIGKELFAFDGIDVYPVSDLNPGAESSNPTQLIEYHEEVYFTAYTPEYGHELWRTDGDKDNPFISVIDVNPSAFDSFPKNLTRFGDSLYFSAEDKSKGRELFSFDGERTALYDIAKGTDSAGPDNLIVVQDKLFFSADDGEKGEQLWVKHLNSPKTEMVKMIFPSGKGRLYDFRQIRNTLFFIADDASRGKILYRSDGTGYGTVEVIDNDGLSVFAASNSFVLLNDKLLFTAKRFFKNELYVAYLGTNNVKWAGIRVSSYGVKDDDSISPYINKYPFPSGQQWEDGVKAISSYFTGDRKHPTQSTLLWIVSTPNKGSNKQKKGCTMEMNRVPGFHSSIRFEKSRSYHEDYFDYFDNAGVKIYVQVEPGWAPLLDKSKKEKGLLSLLSSHLLREDGLPGNLIHPCVEGIGIDLEWFENTEIGNKESGNGRGKEKRIAKWYDVIRKLGLKMYLKHFDVKYMPDMSLFKTELLRLGYNPDNALSDIMFINDSQGFRYYNEGNITPKEAFSYMITKYSNWARHFNQSPVGFQIAYPSDWDCPKNPKRAWYTFLDNDDTENWSDNPGRDLEHSIPEDETWKLIPKLGITISEAIKELGNNQPLGLFFVDYRIRRLLPNNLNNKGNGVFEWEYYSKTLMVDIEGLGSVETNPEKSYFKGREKVTLKAKPEKGWVFKRWNGAINSKKNPIRLTMSSDKTLTAIFSEVSKATLGIQTVGDGRIEIEPGKGPYTPGTLITLKAVPGENSEFRGWKNGISSAKNPVEITITKDMEISGHFSPLKMRKQSLKRLSKGNAVYLKSAAAAVQVKKINVPEIETTEIKHNDPVSHLIMDNRDMESKNSEFFQLNVSFSGNGNVLLDPPGNKYLKGTIVKLSAAPDSCQMFDGWNGDAKGFDNPKTILMDGNKMVSASFSSHDSFSDWTVSSEDDFRSDFEIQNTNVLVIKEENTISEEIRSTFVRAKKVFSQPIHMVSFDLQGNFSKGVKLRLYDNSGKLISDLSGKIGTQTFFPEGLVMGLEFFLHIPSLDEEDPMNAFSVEISNLCVVAGESNPNIDITFRDTPKKTYTGALLEIVADFENKGGIPVENAEVSLNLPVGATLDKRYDWNKPVRNMNRVRRLIHSKSFTQEPPEFYAFSSDGFKDSYEEIFSHLRPFKELKLKISANVLGSALFSESWDPDLEKYYGLNLEEYMKSQNSEIASMTYHQSHLGLCLHEDGHWEGMNGHKRGSRWGIVNTPEEQKMEILLGKYWNEVFFNTRMEGFKSPYLEYNIAPGHEMSTTTPLRTSLSKIIGKAGFRYLSAVKEASNPYSHEPDGKVSQNAIPPRTTLPSWPILCDEVNSGGTNSVGSVLEAYKDHSHNIYSIPIGNQFSELSSGKKRSLMCDNAFISQFNFKDSMKLLREYTHRHFTTIQDEIPRSYITGQRGGNGIFKNIPVTFSMRPGFTNHQIPKNWKRAGKKSASWIFDEDASEEEREDIVKYINDTFPQAKNVTYKEILDYYLGRSTLKWVVKMPKTPGRYSFVVEASDGSSKSFQVDVRSPDFIYDTLSLKGVRVESTSDIKGKRMLGYSDVIYSVKGPDGIDRSGVELDRIISVAHSKGLGVYCHIDVFRDKGMHTLDTLSYDGKVIEGIAEPVDASYRSILKSIVARLSQKDIKGIILESVIPSERKSGHTSGYSDKMVAHFKKFFNPPPFGTNFQDPTSEDDPQHFSIYSAAATKDWREKDIPWLYYDIKKMASYYFKHANLNRLPADDSGVKIEKSFLCKSGVGQDDTGVTGWDEWEAWGEFRKYMVADFVNDIASSKGSKSIFVMVQGAKSAHELLYNSLMNNSSDPVEFADMTRRPNILPDRWNMKKKDHINGIIYSINISNIKDISKVADLAHRIDYWVAKGGNVNRGIMPENKFRPLNDQKIYCLYLNTENIAPGKLFEDIRKAAVKTINPYGVIVSEDISHSRLSR